MSTPSLSIPPRIKPAPHLGLFAGAVMGFTVLGGCALVYFFNPSTHGFFPICMFHQMTGLYCPGCGATRSLYALLHGHWRLALKDNALFIILLALGAVRGIWFAAKRIRRQPFGPFFTTPILWGSFVAAVVFAVVRNLPGFAFLSP